MVRWRRWNGTGTAYGSFTPDKTLSWGPRADCFHIDRPVGEEMNEWQPIETAPKDGIEILLFARGQHNDDYWGVGQWSEQSKDWFWSFAIRPTHWMALPEPPR